MLGIKNGNYRHIDGGNPLLTAEYVYNNPLPTPSNLYLTLKEEGRDSLLNSQEVCVFIRTDDREEKFPYYEDWSVWYLNGTRVAPTDYDFRLIPYLSDEPAPVATCLHFYEGIPIGLNLFEVHIKTSEGDSGIFYQWALNMDTPTPVLTP
jgi:hypothetical protein